MFSREHDELEELRGKQVNRTPEINYFSNYSQPGPLFRGFWEEKNLIYKLTDPKVLTLMAGWYKMGFKDDISFKFKSDMSFKKYLKFWHMIQKYKADL